MAEGEVDALLSAVSSLALYASQARLVPELRRLLRILLEDGDPRRRR